MNMLFVFVVLNLLPILIGATTENVALNKKIIGSGMWHPCAVDGKYRTTFSPNAVEFPYYYLDLGALYNLSSIKLFCQDEWSFGDRGLNELFDVHTYGKPMLRCSFNQFYPWDPLASNLIFKRKRELIELHPEKLVRYIIIGRPNTNYPKAMAPIVIGEIEAYGEKVQDMPDFQIPVDPNPIPENYYKETRRKILGNHDRIWLHPSIGYLEPNYNMKDVVLAWRYKPLVMAVVREGARILLGLGNVLPAEINSHPIYAQLQDTAGSWLNNGSTAVKYSKVTEPYQPGDILLIKSDDKFNVDKVLNDLKSGNNSAVIGCGRESSDSSTNQLIRSLNIGFVRTERFQSDGFVYTRDVVNSANYIPVTYLLDRLINSWNALASEDFDDSDALKWESTEAQAKLNEFIEKYNDVMQNLGPCVLASYTKQESTYRAVINYNKILNHQSGTKCHALPHVQHAPGDVKAGAIPSTVVVKVYADQPGSFFPTGVYAKPGEAFRWSVMDTSDWNLENQYIRINAQTDDITESVGWSRWPIVTSRVPVMLSGQVCSPHGGPIFLQLPKGATLKLKFSNVYRYPWLDMRNKESVKTFEQEVQQYSNVPWLVLNGDSMNTMVMMNDVLQVNMSELLASVRFHDDAVKMIHNFRGTKWENAMTEVFVTDVQITFGYGHSGYPMMGYPQWSHDFLHFNRIKEGYDTGFIHEIGHNLQVWEATLKNGEEVTNNVYRTLVKHHLLEIPAFDERDTGNWNSPEYNGPGWGYYKYMMALFGTGVVGNGFIEARKANPPNENEKTQFWLQQMCKETNYDLLPFHQLWKFPMTNETKQACGRFPCFFPDDQWTRGAQDKVDAILKAYGKKCLRTNPNQVEFRGDVMRGIGTVRPQNIFREVL